MGEARTEGEGGDREGEGVSQEERSEWVMEKAREGERD